MYSENREWLHNGFISRLKIITLLLFFWGICLKFYLDGYSDGMKRGKQITIEAVIKILEDFKNKPYER